MTKQEIDDYLALRLAYRVREVCKPRLFGRRFTIITHLRPAKGTVTEITRPIQEAQ